MRTVLAPIPVAPELRQHCEEAVQPEGAVTGTDALQFGFDAATEAKCWKAIAVAAVGAMDAHNEAAED